MFSKILDFFSPKYLGLYLLTIAIVLSLTAVNITGKWLDKKQQAATTINTVGLAMQDVKSDLVQWDLSLEKESDSPQTGYRELNEENNKLLSFLKSEGVSNESIFGPNFSTYKKDITEVDKDGASKVVGQSYVTTASYQIRTKNVDTIGSVSAKLINFLAQNSMILASNSISYIYTGLENLKLELLKQASANAKLRAEAMTSANSLKIKRLLSADQGVFQINRKGDYEVSYEGVFDTTGVDKTVRATISSTYLME